MNATTTRTAGGLGVSLAGAQNDVGLRLRSHPSRSGRVAHLRSAWRPDAWTRTPPRHAEHGETKTMTPTITHENRQKQTRSSVCVYTASEAEAGGGPVLAESRYGGGVDSCRGGGSGGCCGGWRRCYTAHLLTYYILVLYYNNNRDENNDKVSLARACV